MLNLDQKVEAIKLLDSGKPAYKVAKIYGVGEEAKAKFEET